MQNTTKRIIMITKKGSAFCPAPSAQSKLIKECKALRKEYMDKIHSIRVQTAIALQSIDINGYIAHAAMEWLNN
jgi:hypothetical protein